MSIFLFSVAMLPINAADITAKGRGEYSTTYDAYYLPDEADQKTGSKEPSFKRTLRPEDVKHNYRKANYKNIQVLFDCGIRSSGRMDNCKIREISPDNDNSRKSVAALVKYYVLNIDGGNSKSMVDRRVFIATSIKGLGAVAPVEEPCVAPLCSITPPPVPVQ